MAKLRIYVAGPYTKGDVVVNVAHVVEWGDWLLDRGFAPYLPHLSHFWHFHCPRPYEDWTDLDLEWLPLCHAVLRLSGESEGADKETGTAFDLHIPVFYDDDPDALLGWARKEQELREAVLRRGYPTA